MKIVTVKNKKGEKMAGVGNYPGGVYTDLKIDGVCTISGDLEAESLDIDGVCTCTGNITVKKFDCDGVITIEGNLRAGTADIDGVVTVNGEKIEADRIDCDGVLTAGGEISADVIEADGVICAKEIVGDHIRIKSFRNPVVLFFTKHSGTNLPKFSRIDLIEGTTVELRGVQAKSVNGQDVTIGKNCVIDKVSASGILSVHPSSKITETLS